MNKYSKAVKTAATVGMSLAMVLSAVTPVSAAYDNVNACKITDLGKKEAVADFFNELVEVIEETVEDGVYGVKLDTEIKFKGEYTTLTEVFADDFTAEVVNKTNVYEVLKEYAGCTSNKKIKHLAGIVEGVEELSQYLVDTNVEYYAEGERTDVWDVESNSYFKADHEGLVSDEAGITKYIDSIKADKKFLVSNKYKGNLGAGKENGRFEELYNQTLELVNNAITSYYGDNMETVIGLYTAELEELIEDAFGAPRTAVAEEVDWEKPQNVVATSSSLKELTKLLADIENDKIDSLTDIAAYEDVENDVDVMEMIESLETAIENVETVIDLTAEKDNDTLKDYTSKHNDGKDNKTIVGNKVTDLDWADVDADDVYDEFTTEEIAKIEAFVEEIGAAFYDVTTRTYGSKYSVRITGADYYGNLSEAELTNIAELLGMSLDSNEGITNKGIFTLGDDKGNTYYDLLVKRAADTKEYLETATTEIKGITVHNLTSANAAKILAAKEAVEKLDGFNLTDAENDLYEEAKDYVDVLYKYMLYNGIVAEPQNQWIELEDGNWDYYVDGKAFTGWVASGKDWFYVRNGHMLRNSWVAKDSKGDVWYYVGGNGAMVTNTTIDGCYINSYGAWTK